MGRLYNVFHGDRTVLHSGEILNYVPSNEIHIYGKGKMATIKYSLVESHCAMYIYFIGDKKFAYTSEIFDDKVVNIVITEYKKTTSESKVLKMIIRLTFSDGGCDLIRINIPL